ncbi:MAG TPA: hypothetical protein VKR22_13525, partial [Acidimicrobiales bacterium]|nr:hypothetical protein [Acidimicrobiales bacterium]
KPASAAKNAPAKRAAAKAKGAEDLSGLSKSELYDRATALDLPGRSKMSRDELERAIASAGSGARRRKAS